MLFLSRIYETACHTRHAAFAEVLALRLEVDRLRRTLRGVGAALADGLDDDGLDASAGTAGELAEHGD